MASLRDVRRRIASIQSTQKITRAFYVISATRLRKAQQQAEASRPYAEKMYEVLGTTSRRAREYRHPFLEQREGRRAVMILVTTDRGLAGALNVNTIRAATRRMNEDYSDHPRFVTIGRKGRDFLRRFGRDVIADTSGLGDRIHLSEILPAVTVALDEYREGRCDAVLLAYAKFVSTLRQEPEVRRLVPVDLGEMEAAAPEGPSGDYFYEPEPEDVMDALLPRYVESQVYQAVLENKASEFAARMVAMKNATDAAGDLIDSLTLTANKVRQATITTELMEIVSGAEALRSSS
ncbi:MAG TPA: ATP synthase F1 subunit gamma [Candidatus Dormibacteraeota bacterium]